MGLIIRWIVAIIAVFVAAKLVPGIHFDNLTALAIFAAVLGLVNAVIRPVLKLLALPLIIITFGLVSLVINALMFLLAAYIVPGFAVDGFISALFGSIIVSIVGALLSMIVPQ